jgi:hypothetical protein
MSDHGDSGIIAIARLEPSFPFELGPAYRLNAARMSNNDAGRPFIDPCAVEARSAGIG